MDKSRPNFDLHLQHFEYSGNSHYVLHTGEKKNLHFSDKYKLCEIWSNILLLTDVRIKHEVPVLCFVCEFTTTLHTNNRD